MERSPVQEGTKAHKSARIRAMNPRDWYLIRAVGSNTMAGIENK